MDLSEKWKTTYQSVCLIEHYKNKILIGSGTGFKVSDKIITNNHVFQNSGSDYSIIKFIEEDCVTIRASKTYDSNSFKDLIIQGDNPDNWDFAILEANEPDFNTIPSLYVARDYNVQVGKSIYFLGFPLLKPNLTICHGTIASKFVKSNVKYIQINGNVNNGNSGGPLLDLETDCVIGVVTRKSTGLSERFGNLKKSFNSNILELKKSRKDGFILVSGIDPMESLEVVQNQFNDLCDEIVRSSNVGIGYAFELDEINKCI